MITFLIFRHGDADLKGRGKLFSRDEVEGENNNFPRPFKQGGSVTNDYFSPEEI